MFSEKNISVLLAALLALLLCACSSLRKYSGSPGTGEAPSLSLPQEESLDSTVDRSMEAVVDSSAAEDGPLIMNAVRDSRTGEMTATDVIAASRIVARFRNVAERMGMISIAFDVTVPESLVSSDLQLRFSPVISTRDGSQALKPVLITGRNYRRRQLRGYERYRNFLKSIVSDSLAFIRVAQLEKFIERYFPDVHAMKTDSSVIPEPVAENLFGVTQAAVLRHYTRQASRERNAARMENRGEMFRRYVKAPILMDVSLDTVMSPGKGRLTYRYSHTMPVEPGVRKLSVSLDGAVYRKGEKVAGMPSPENLEFYISSMSSLADNTPRYVFRVVSRSVSDNTRALLDFRQGSIELDTLSEGNSSELGRIRRCLEDIYRRKDLVLDSIIVTASCSPEGSVSTNSRLARGRAATVKSYVFGRCPGWLEDGSVRSRYVPENWEYLVRIVENDSLIGSRSKEVIRSAASMEDRDEAERRFSSLPEYRYLREKIYPRLRTVDFSFYMHRPDMEKDTLHTTELDTVYMKGLEALRNLDYRKAVTLLGVYGDYNSALALAAAGYDESALSVLSALKGRDARSDYLEAMLLARLGRPGAAESFRRSVSKDPSMRHRANLDPEMSVVLESCRDEK
ncbi:MAG: hypothetical protein IAC29_00710 [Bacteroidetes bacterium]|uniref:Uncharacterized protein n=1 Tax=Candidatus Cryptobacteroides merdigallinarum TaxID=2840770 RepID=A0A9D9EIY7_9BACT|nr:hypothetical protein [Candidatus Cryptobacteroides merdigallinarum]